MTRKNKMTNWTNSFRRAFTEKAAYFCAICCWFLLVIIFLLAVINYTKKSISELYENTHMFIEAENNITKEEYTQIETLIAKNRIIPVTVVYENTLKYYDNLMTLLVALLGIFAFVSWIYLKGRVSNQIRDNIHEELQSKWFEICLKDRLKEYVSKNLSDYLAELYDIENIRGIVREELEKAQDIEDKKLAVIDKQDDECRE